MDIVENNSEALSFNLKKSELFFENNSGLIGADCEDQEFQFFTYPNSQSYVFSYPYKIEVYIKPIVIFFLYFLFLFKQTIPFINETEKITISTLNCVIIKISKFGEEICRRIFRERVYVQLGLHTVVIYETDDGKMIEILDENLSSLRFSNMSVIKIVDIDPEFDVFSYMINMMKCDDKYLYTYRSEISGKKEYMYYHELNNLTIKEELNIQKEHMTYNFHFFYGSLYFLSNEKIHIYSMSNRSIHYVRSIKININTLHLNLLRVRPNNNLVLMQQKKELLNNVERIETRLYYLNPDSTHNLILYTDDTYCYYGIRLDNALIKLTVTLT